MRVRSFRVQRGAVVGAYKLSEVIAGLESSVAQRKVFGSRIQMTKVMRHLKLRVERGDSGLWLDRDTGTVCIGSKHLATA